MYGKYLLKSRLCCDFSRFIYFLLPNPLISSLQINYNKYEVVITHLCSDWLMLYSKRGCIPSTTFTRGSKLFISILPQIRGFDFPLFVNSFLIPNPLNNQSDFQIFKNICQCRCHDSVKDKQYHALCRQNNRQIGY